MNASPSPHNTKRNATRVALWSLFTDLVLVAAFTLIGRNSHDREATLTGFFQTSWPFLGALLVMWLITLPWRRPLSIVRTGIPIWLGTCAIGLILRVWFSDSGAALPFVLVTFLTLGLFLIGWRAITLLILNLRSRRTPAAALPK